MRSVFLLVAICMCVALSVGAKDNGYDTSYVENHSKDLAVRLLGDYRFSGYKIGDKNYTQPLKYKSNDNFNLGVGATYRFISASFGFKAPVVNNDNNRFGNTKSFDLQSNIYLRKFTIDIYTQFYHGYYLKNSDIVNVAPTNGEYILRPDMKTRSLGVNAQYIFNNTKFSYRAAYVQDQYQQRSAGSVIIGAGIHHFKVDADSALVPQQIIENGFYDKSGFNHTQVFNISATAGYAYTQVIHSHFFVSGSLMAGIGTDVTSLTDDKLHTKERKSGLQTNGVLRVAGGYNTDQYFAGITYIDYLSKNMGPIAGTWQEFETGSLKLTLAKRFGVKRNVIHDVYKKVLPEDKTLEKLHLDNTDVNTDVNTNVK